ncbi:hypothetical protein ACJIZ3_020887 [Penstemon smallii]|uniref:F-box domain-containing protein n=1 Tax=Penstemon smallii TaxID=265156 RepID=A0ABD3SK56_9LAMI
MDYFKKKKTKKWGWADLPCDIIELVLKKLHFTAQIRFAAVCRSWRGVSEKYCTSTSSSYRLPCIIYVQFNIIVHYIYKICLSKDREWIQGTPETSQNELCSVHYMNGKLYCLFIGGLLKTYSLANNSWELLTPSLPAGNLDLYTTRCWLIEIGDENLIMIGCKSFELGNESEWSVFKFDWSIMSWILETSLKNIALFISGDISYSTPSIDVNGKILQDFKVFYFDDDRCYIGEEYRKFYSSEHSWIKKTHRAMNFIEPPYVRK